MLIGAVEHDVGIADQVICIGLGDRLGVEAQGDMRIERACKSARAFRLAGADGGGCVDDLPLQIGERDRIRVDNGHVTDARCGQIGDGRTAQPAGAHDQHACAFQLLLRRPAKPLEHQMARVAPGFLGGERALRGQGEPPGSAGPALQNRPDRPR